MTAHFFNGKVLKWIIEHKYAGGTISDDFKEILDLKQQMKSLYAKGNTLVRTFYLCLSDIKTPLFQFF